jgi:Tfp pilus assembly protein PilZ
MSEGKGSTARQEPRYQVDLTALFEGFGTKPQEGRVVDVSTRGLYLEIDDLPSQKSFGSCRLNLPNSEETVALGICVVRVKPPRDERPGGVGLQLFGNDDRILRLWNDFIDGVRQEVANTDDAQTVFGPSINALLEHQFEHQLEALVVYLGDLPTGRLFVPTSHNLAIGDIIELNLGIVGFEDVHTLRGEVIARTNQTGDRGVEILLYDMSPRRLAAFWHWLCDTATP